MSMSDLCKLSLIHIVDWVDFYEIKTKHGILTSDLEQQIMPLALSDTGEKTQRNSVQYVHINNPMGVGNLKEQAKQSAAQATFHIKKKQSQNKNIHSMSVSGIQTFGPVSVLQSSCTVIRFSLYNLWDVTGTCTEI